MIKLSDIELGDNDIVYESNDDNFYRLMTITMPVQTPSIPVSTNVAAFVRVSARFYLNEEILSNTKHYIHNENTPVLIVYAFNSTKSKEIAGKFSKAKQPCTVLNKVKFWWCDVYFCIVSFLTEDPLNDVYVIHPSDLKKLK